MLFFNKTLKEKLERNMNSRVTPSSESWQHAPTTTCGPRWERHQERALQRVGENKQFDSLEGSFPTIACKRTQPLILRRLVPFVYQLQPWLLRCSRLLCNSFRIQLVDSSSIVLLHLFQPGDSVSRFANSYSVSIRVRYLDLYFFN